MLDFEYEARTNQEAGPTFKDLMGAPPGKKWTDKELGIKGKRGRPKKTNKDQVQEEFRREAGSLKQKPK